MLRPLFYEFDDDPRAFADCDDFMLGPNLLVASVVEPGSASDASTCREALDGLVRLLVPARGIAAGSKSSPPRRSIACRCSSPPARCIPPPTPAISRACTTSRRGICASYPPRDAGVATFALYEDDGRSLDYAKGHFAVIDVEMRATRRVIEINAHKTGPYALPYRSIRVILPVGERRRVVLTGKGVELVRAAAAH